MRCINCGSDNDDDNLFCLKCGMKLKNDAITKEVEYPKSTPRTVLFDYKKAFIISIAINILLLIMLIISFSGKSESTYDGYESEFVAGSEYCGEWATGEAGYENKVIIFADGTYRYERGGLGAGDNGKWNLNEHGGITFQASDSGVSEGNINEKGKLETIDRSHTQWSVGDYTFHKNE